MSETSESQGTEMKCHKCEYEWTYSGEMWHTTCPRCKRTTPTGLEPDDF